MPFVGIKLIDLVVSDPASGVTMLTHLRPALVLTLLFTLLTGIAYPLAITGIGQVAFPAQANGSLVRNGETVVGSALIGQNFASDRYFWPRPRSTADAPYNAGASPGSNLGPTSAKLADARRDRRRAACRAGVAGPVPADAATASGSGLDPDISPAYASAQVAASPPRAAWRRPRSPRWSGATPKAACSASSASRASMCCNSTWRSMRLSPERDHGRREPQT